MSKKEVLQILAILRSVYPNTKSIDNADATAMVWMMCLEDYNADQVMKAARLHMNTSKFFPTPAEIIEKIPRACIVFGGDLSRKGLGDGKREIISIKEKEGIDERLERFCRFMGFGYDEENNS